MPRSGGDEVYAGACGQTRTDRVHFSCTCGLIYDASCHVAVNATRDPDRARAFLEQTLDVARCPSCGTRAVIEVPTVVHDEARRRLWLVLPHAYRTRELEERAALLTAMARDRAASVPSYARDFVVTFGVEELAAQLGAAESARSDERSTVPFARDPDTDGGDADADADADARTPVRDPVVDRWAASGETRMHLTVDGQARCYAAVPPAQLEAFTAGPIEARIALHSLAEYPLVVLSFHAPRVEPIALPLDVARLEDRALLGALSAAFQITLELYGPGYVAAGRHELEAPLAENVRALAGAAEAHMATIAAGQRSFGAALQRWSASSFDRYGRRDPGLDEGSFVSLASAKATRAALGVIGFWSEAENEQYLTRVRSFPLPWLRAIRARVLVRAVQYGLALPAVLVPHALAEGMARSRKDLAQALAQAFVHTAVAAEAHGLEPEQVRENWKALAAEGEALGVTLEGRAAELAAEAVGTGAVTVNGGARAAARGAATIQPVTIRPGSGSSAPVARAARLAATTERMPAHETRRAAITSEAGAVATGTLVAHGIAPGNDRDAPPIVHGEIRTRGTPAHRDLGTLAGEDLVRLLDDKDLRREAAIELARRGDPSAVGPVFGALRRMTRGEAVRVLPTVVAFGERAVPHLTDGLRSRKAFLRQGCALALGVLKSADGIEALCDLLLAEPTDVWREVARAIGEIGSGAVMSLAARLRAAPEAEAPGADEATLTAEQRQERVSWALAHVTARGGRGPVETLADGRDTVAAEVARRALEMTTTARSNDAEVRGGPAPRDQTVNRAFSRRFFEALAGRAPRPLAIEPDEEELTLDDAEILDEEELLDDDDLLPG